MAKKVSIFISVLLLSNLSLVQAQVGFQSSTQIYLDLVKPLGYAVQNIK
jgi:hypothetical protein